jgi:hypothetical protein
VFSLRSPEWYVTVTAEGYKPLISPVVGVPPEVTHL